MRVEHEYVGTRTDWTVRSADHVLIAHLDGSLRSIETQVDGVAVAVAPLTGGDVSLVPAGHQYDAQATGSVVRYAVVRVTPAALNESVSDGTDGALDAVRLGHRAGFLYQSIQRLAGLIGRADDASHIAAHGVSHVICVHLHDIKNDARRNPRTPRAARGFTASSARYLRSFIHANLGECLALPTLAALVELSPHQLLIDFRRAFGTTPAQYIIMHRLHRARWLLRYSRHDISTIAASTGFASHSHLTTTFRRHVGITPQAFRAQARRS